MGDALKKVQGESLYRAAEFNLSSINEEKRTIDVVFTTGHKGRRSSWWRDESWNEELEVSESAMKMDRLNNGAPFLNLHRAYNLDDVIGVVQKAWIEDGKGMATVRFSKREEVDKLWNEVKDGILRNVSVGYNVYKWEDVTERDDKITSLRAVDWEPMEISLVPIGFDPGAQTRSKEENKSFEMQIITRGPNPKEERMSEKNKETKETKKEAAPQVDLDQVRSEASKQGENAGVEAERKRVSEITMLCRKHGIDAETADKLINDGVSPDQARSQILDVLATKSEEVKTRVSVTPGDRDDKEVMKRGMETAIRLRVGQKIDNKDDLEMAREFRHGSLLDYCRYTLELNGENHRNLTKHELAKRAMSTSDFPEILAGTVNRSLRAAYEAAPQTFLPLIRTVENADLKEISRTQLSGGGLLQEVKEGGEYKRAYLAEAAEKYRIKKYGEVVAITYESIINDDMDAFGRIPMEIGQDAADLESDLFWAIFTGNPKMGDGKTLFHADHGNQSTSAGAIAEATLDAARVAIRSQTNKKGRKLNLQPAFLIVPTELESKAKTFLNAQIVPTKTADVNTFRGSMEPIVEPRLSDDSASKYYVTASAKRIDIIERAYLQGEEGLVTEQRMGFDVDGLEIKARVFVGFAPIDWRGVYRNS